MSKHTPGPWNRGIGQIIFQGAAWDPHGRQRRVATCDPSTRTEQDWNETWANARLIATTPELLDALNALTNMAEAFPNELHKDHPAVIAARIVIAKATGEQQ